MRGEGEGSGELGACVGGACDTGGVGAGVWDLVVGHYQRHTLDDANGQLTPNMQKERMTTP